MSPNEITLKLTGEGRYELPLNHKGMKDITVESWWKIGFSNTRLLAAAALICFSAFMEYELDVLKPGARYKDLESSLRWRLGKDETGHAVIKSIEIDVKVDVPEEYRSEFREVVKEHNDHGCLITRSLKRGIPIKFSISEA
jgi:organic hydroperoxide reductase OsmC/OhrA